MQVEAEMLEKWVRRLRALEPGAVAVLLTGSYAQGRAGPQSDVDLTVVVEGDPVELYRAFLVRRPGGELLHISISTESVEARRAEADEPAEWSWYFPVEVVEQALWVAPEAEGAVRVGGVRPGGGMELEDFVSCACKLGAALDRGDAVEVRHWAHELAAYCPSLLVSLNPPRTVRHPYEALRAALNLPVHPSGYAEDMLACLGLSDGPASVEEVYRAAMRLALGTVELLAPHAAELAGRVEPDLHLYLADGALLEYVRRLDEGEQKEC